MRFLELYEPLANARQQLSTLDPISSEIAKYLHANEHADYLTQIAEHADKREMSAPAYQALLNAQMKRTPSALDAFDREIRRMYEEEELAMLLALAD